MNKERQIRLIEARSHLEAKYLAGEFARAASEEREAVLASLEFERWLAESCQAAYRGR